MASRSLHPMIVSIRSLRKFVPLALLVLVLGLAGCGGDDEDEPSAGTDTSAETTEETTATEQDETTTEEAEPDPETETLPDDGDGTSGPENGPGGAGDEEPAQTLALFTGENGRISPSVVRVPAYISIRVEVHSGDGAEYGLTFDGETIKVSGGLGSVSTTIDGLRPGAKIVGTPIGASNRVRIEATAEPGP
jgi:hypothetical protein